MENCYVCSSNVIATPEYISCPSCGVLRTTYPYQESVYGEDYAEQSLQNTINDVNLPLMINRLFVVTKRLPARSSLLDIGCGVGEFIRFAEQYYVCYGVEPNEYAIAASSDRYHSPVYSHLNGQIPPVNMVTLFDVLEHLDDPREFMSTIRYQYLLEGGYLLITTPCLDAVPHGGVVQQWKHWKPKEHLFLFTQESLFKLFDQSGFKIVHVDFEESNIRPGNPNKDIITVVGRKV